MVRYERMFLAVSAVSALELTLNDWFRVFGKDRAVDEKRGAPGPQRVFIPYIFKRGYDPEETSLGMPMDTTQSDYDNFDNEFNFDLPSKMKRGASQYYLLHFGMPGASRRAPKPQRSYQVGKRGDDFWSKILNYF